MKVSLKKTLIIIAYFFSYILAFAQLRYSLYEGNIWRIIYQCTVYILIGVSVFSIGINLKNRKVSRLSLLLILFVLYEFFVTFVCGINGHIKRIIIDIPAWPLLWSIFFDFSRKNEIPKSFNIITIVGMVLCCVLSIPNIKRHLVDYGNFGGVIFPVYFTFSFFTILLLLDIDKKVKVEFGIIIVLLLLISTKRAGAASVVLGISFYYIIKAYITSTLREKIKHYGVYLLLGAATVLIGSYVINKYDIPIINRYINLSTDGGSGRIYIWLDVMNHFRVSTKIEKIFGHGFHAVYYLVQPNGVQRMAHNSFLETLYDYGIVGLLFLFVLLFQLFKYFFKMIKSQYKYAPMMAYSIVPLVFLSFFSYFFEQTIIIVPYVIAWGIMMGRFDVEGKID